MQPSTIFRKFLSAISLLVFAHSIPVVGQLSQNPRGIYKMTKLVDRSGKEIPAPFDQYKICEDYATLTFRVVDQNRKDIQFALNINDRIIYNHTGKTPQGKDMHGSQIYDSDGQHFRLRWWSTYKNHRYFPENNWVVEQYEKDIFSSAASSILKLLKDNPRPVHNQPFEGRWYMVDERDDKADIQHLAQEKSFSSKTSTLHMMVVQKGQVLLLHFRNTSERNLVEGHLQPFTHHGKDEMQLSNRIYRLYWQDEQRFYFEADNGRFQLWMRDNASPPYYDLSIHWLHDRFLQSQPLATQQLQDMSRAAASTPSSANDSIYLAPDIIASFPGGGQAMREYLKAHLHYPTNALPAYGLQGRLLVTFIVEKDGRISQSNILRNDMAPKGTAATYSVEEDTFRAAIDTGKATAEHIVLRAIREMPRWEPAINHHNGQAERVRMRMTLPITFFP